MRKVSDKIILQDGSSFRCQKDMRRLFNLENYKSFDKKEENYV